MGVKLVSASAGSVEIVAPTTASNYTATMPAGTGNVVVNGINSSIVSGTSQASTSGTSIDFTSIPSWVKRITVMFSVVSTNGSSSPQIQLGTGSTTYTTSGYSAFSANISAIASTASVSSGFVTNSTAASNALSGSFVITLLGSNTWTCFGGVGQNATNSSIVMGAVSLAAVLTAVRITTVNGTDTFDAGSINILYE
jgi:hypothetical protein